MRIRTIKPEFWLHEGLCACSDFTRLMAIALLNWADDAGYFMAHPSLLRGGLFPFLDDSKKIPGTLQDLSRVGWIQLGTDNQGRPVGRILNFSKHQRVDKPQASRIKDLCTFQEDSKNDLGTFQEPSRQEGNGKGKEQGIGKEQGMDRAKASSPEEVEEFAVSLGCPAGQGAAAYWKWEGNGWVNGKAAIKDWRATVRAWRAQGYAPFLTEAPAKAAPKSFAQIDREEKEAARYGAVTIKAKVLTLEG
jgi:hypothetical protein